jgi:hypothetical protein
VFRTSHALKTLASLEEVWALVKDVTKWKTWLQGVRQIQLHGPMIAGAQGLMFLLDGNVHELSIQKYDLGHLEVVIKLRLGVRLRLVIDVLPLPVWTKVKLAGELFGAMSFLHAAGWGKTLRNGLAPAARLLGILSQEMRD